MNNNNWTRELNDSLLARFRDADIRLDFAKILDGIQHSKRHCMPFFSEFLDPKRVQEFSIALQSVGSAVITFRAFGGYSLAERRLIGVMYNAAKGACDSAEGLLGDQDFPIDVVHVSYNAKFGKAPSHRDYLGAVLGLGIKRQCVGDIAPLDSGAFIVLQRSIADYVAANLDKVGNVHVKTAHKQLCEVSFPHSEKRLKTITLASLRLDSVISACFNMSRNEAARLVASEKVFINWTPVTSPSKHVVYDDMITVRGVGRVHILDESGRTRKDRVILNVELF